MRSYIQSVLNKEYKRCSHCHPLPGDKVIGFKAESGMSKQDLIKKARGRMDAYDLDAIVANDIDAAGRSATSVILITANNEVEISGTKSKVSDAIMDYCARL